MLRQYLSATARNVEAERDFLGAPIIMNQDAAVCDAVEVFSLDGEVTGAVGAGEGAPGYDRDQTTDAVELFAFAQLVNGAVGARRVGRAALRLTMSGPVTSVPR